DIELETRLIDDLLDINRILAGKFEIRRQGVDLCDVLRRAIHFCQPDLQKGNLTLVSRFSSAPLAVRADPVRLQQVFWNLLRNAVKFTPPGGRITLETTVAQDQVCTSIIDTGIGIAPEMLPRIFEAFTQAYSKSGANGGLGLGLAISRAIVDA